MGALTEDMFLRSLNWAHWQLGSRYRRSSEVISVKRACLPIRNPIGATSSLDQLKHEALDYGSRGWRAIHVVNSHLEGFTNAQHAHDVDIREDAYRHQHVNGLCRATRRQRFW